MKGSITRNARSGTYYARVDAPPGPDGRRRQVRLSAPTKREIQAKVARAISDIERGIVFNRKRVTVGQLLDRFMESKRRISFLTRESYCRQIDLYLKPAFGHLPLSALTSARIQEAIDRWSVEPRFDNKHGVRSARTMKLPLSILSQALRYGRALELCGENPMQYVVLPSERKKMKPVADMAHLIQIFAALVGSHLFLPIWIAFSTGLRRGEILALRRGSITTDGCLKVDANVVCRGKRIQVKEPKTLKSTRELPLSDSTLGMLNVHLASQEKLLSSIGVPVSEDTWLFDDGFGGLWHPDSFGKAYRRALTTKGLAPLRLHGTRHTFTTIARSLKVDSSIISALLGHESADITGQYGIVEVAAKRDAMSTIERTLLGALRNEPFI